MKIDIRSTEQYFKDLQIAFDTATKDDSIVVCTMAFEPETHRIQTLCQSMAEAATRGVHITLIFDAYSFLLYKNLPLGPLLYSKSFATRWAFPVFRKRADIVEKLKTSGVQVVILNIPKKRLSNPVSGRSHIKYAQINNDSYIGGCNLVGKETIDYMVHTQNEKVSQELSSLTGNFISLEDSLQAIKHDKKIMINDSTELLIDAGEKNISLIADNALALVHSASKQIVLTCQFAPGGRLATALSSAQQRNVAIRVFYNSPLKHLFLTPVHLVHYVLVRIRFNSRIYSHMLPRKSPYLHAKILCSETEAMIGSHNYVDQGVHLGTAEIALKSTNGEFLQKIQDLITLELLHNE